MLVLSRKVGQTIVIGDGIEITVIELRGDQVRLGIHAPREVPVNRKEILGRCTDQPDTQPSAQPSATMPNRSNRPRPRYKRAATLLGPNGSHQGRGPLDTLPPTSKGVRDSIPREACPAPGLH
jgi:carbon storage regulator